MNLFPRLLFLASSLVLLGSLGFSYTANEYIKDHEVREGLKQLVETTNVVSLFRECPISDAYYFYHADLNVITISINQLCETESSFNKRAIHLDRKNIVLRTESGRK